MSNFYFNVPYNDKDKAKELGARFSKDEKSWFAHSPEIRQKMAKFWTEKVSTATEERKGWNLDNKFSYQFEVPLEKGTYAEKMLGADFDTTTWQWFAPTDSIWNEMIRYFQQSLTKDAPLELFDMEKRKNYEKDVLETYNFDIKFNDKDDAKKLGAVWSKTENSWTAPNKQVWNFMIAYWPQKLDANKKKPSTEEENNSTNPEKKQKQEQEKLDKKLSSEFLLDDTEFVLARSFGGVYNVATNTWTAPNNEVWTKMCNEWEPL